MLLDIFMSNSDILMRKLEDLKLHGGGVTLKCGYTEGCDCFEKEDSMMEIAYSRSREKFVASCSSGRSDKNCRFLASRLRGLDLEFRFYKMGKKIVG